MRDTLSKRMKSIAGTALVGTGIFVLYQNILCSIAQLKHALGVEVSQTGGIPPAVVQAVSQALQVCAASHERVLHFLLQYLLITSWPLLLVLAGTILSREAVAENLGDVQEGKTSK
ncbi:MAG TPA: hypothetical protein VMU61_15205 [Candidatus Aquilonibacter sp.]|nr:hypothetical protein [Candidatus Aquilonibacter sp.]